jgi:hypothetical protein
MTIVSWGPISWVYMSEVMPMQIRARGNAFATGIGNWLVSASFLLSCSCLTFLTKSRSLRSGHRSRPLLSKNYHGNFTSFSLVSLSLGL